MTREGYETMSELIKLENRSVIEIKGPDAQDFLQGILTNDILGAKDNHALYAGLLTPQGKLLFDFFVVKHQDAYLFDVEKDQVQDLVKRLMFYKLRANLDITALESAIICANLSETTREESENSITFNDPRFKKMGSRILILDALDKPCTTNPDEWITRRIQCGLPEAGHDYTYGSCFPHDIAMDQLNGIGFKKGCYVGQEVVSRMQHRGTARKRPMIVRANQTLPTAPGNIEAQGKVIGHLGSAFETNGLAEVRLDRASKALEDGKPFQIGELEVQLMRPSWASYGEEFEAVE